MTFQVKTLNTYFYARWDLFFKKNRNVPEMVRVSANPRNALRYIICGPRRICARITYASRQINMRYLLVNRMVFCYFFCYFYATNFFMNESVILHVKLRVLLPVAKFFKYSWFFRCTALMDITSADFYARPNRFELTYVLLSTKKNERVYLRIFCDERKSVPSLSAVFDSANWLEREAWDMFGVVFAGHPDLRRILTDYGFFGHPLRKDFPLTGFYELRFDDTYRRVVSEALNLVQEPRVFFFAMPWVAMQFC